MSGAAGNDVPDVVSAPAGIPAQAGPNASGSIPASAGDPQPGGIPAVPCESERVTGLLPINSAAPAWTGAAVSSGRKRQPENLTPAQKDQRYSLILALRGQGETIASIARLLGFSESYLQTWVRDYRAYGAERSRPRPETEKPRRCLRCREDFLSAGPHNRLCDPCRSFVSGMSPMSDGPGDCGSKVGVR